MHPGYAVPALVFATASAGGFWFAQRKANKVKLFQQEELDVGQVQRPGVCKVLGLVAANETIASPFGGSPCVWFRLEVQEYVRSGRVSRWVTIHREVAHTRFLLKDRRGTHTIGVNLEGAEVLLASEGGSDNRAVITEYLAKKGKTRVLGYGELRAVETTLSPDEKVFILGTATHDPQGLTMEKGSSAFVLSDTDSGQVAYSENTAMYVGRFWGGISALMSLWWLWQLVRR
jgi:hypothetical protein